MKENSERISTYRLTHDEMLVIGTAVTWATLADGNAGGLSVRRSAEDALIAAVRAWQRGNVAALEKQPPAKTNKRKIRRAT